MAATLKLYANLFSKVLQISSRSAIQFDLPSFAYGDVWPVVFQVIEPDPNGGPNNFVKPSIENSTLRFTLTDVPAIDPTGATAFVTQYTWAKDTTLRTFAADIAFNTAALGTFLSTATEKTATARFYLLDSANTVEILRRDVVVKNGTVTTPTVPAGETALSLERALALFVKNEEDAGAYRIRTSVTGLKFIETFGDDGIPHWEQIT